MTKQDRLVCGISGASGVAYGVRLLQVLRAVPIETHLVMSRAAEEILACETDWKPADVQALADVVHEADDVGAPIASGSFLTRGMIIAPCSIRTLSEIAHGTTSSLLTRAADVVLKERRRLVLLVRETPLHAGHLRSMLEVTQMGGIVATPVPALYTRPASVQEIIDQSVGRLLDLFDIETRLVRRWGEDCGIEDQ